MELSELIEALGDRGRAMSPSEFEANASNARHPGIYAWWADDEARRLIEDTLGADAAERPIYIGQASQSQTLATRVLRKHLKGSTRNSTLR